MVLKLYAVGLSPPARLVGLTLLEKGVPFEVVPVDLPKGEHKLPEHVANHPFGQIPYIIDDDGFTLYESRAIARYIATKYADRGPKLIPTGDPKAYALFEQATFAEMAHIYEPAFSLFVEVVFAKVKGKPSDQAKIESTTAILNTKFDIYEKILSKQKYIAGNEFTLADLGHVPLIGALRDGGVDFGVGRPHVNKWLNDILSRESWQSIRTNGLVSTP